MIFAITYDISDSKRDHTDLFEAIQSLGSWMHYMDSTWLVSAPQYSRAEGLFETLRPHLDEAEDFLLVIRVQRNFHDDGSLPS